MKPPSYEISSLLSRGFFKLGIGFSVIAAGLASGMSPGQSMGIGIGVGFILASAGEDFDTANELRRKDKET